MVSTVMSELDPHRDWIHGSISHVTRVRHANNRIAKYMYVVDTLDNMRTLLSVYKALPLTALGLRIATASTVLGEGIDVPLTLSSHKWVQFRCG